MAAPLSLIYLGSAMAFATLAAFHDVRERRIPNLLCGFGMLTGLLLHLTLSGVVQCAWALFSGLLAGVIFLLFYLAGGMGAGDVKLITAVGCLAGIAFLKDILLATVFTGALCALVLATARGRLRQTLGNVFTLLAHHQTAGLTAHPELNVANRAMLRLPYAVPIAIGCFVAFALEISRGSAL
jgi:prepilin peptidase CpaA